jgi:hypothetical protein
MSKYFTLVCITPCIHEGRIPLIVTVYSAPKKEMKNTERTDFGLEERDHVISIWHNNVKNKQGKLSMVPKHQELHSNGGDSQQETYKLTSEVDGLIEW